nr:MAG TPA: hypothetical protein [Bacteriophage sp.]
MVLIIFFSNAFEFCSVGAYNTSIIQMCSKWSNSRST